MKIILLIMPRRSTVLLVCLSVAFAQAIVSQRPCMNVIKFIEQQEDRWFVDVVLKDPAGLEGVWLNLTLDTKAQLLSNKFGPATTLDNQSYLIKRLDYNLKGGQQELVRLMVKYNGLIAPSIIKVLLNGRSLCPGSIFVEENECPPQINVTVSGQLNIEDKDQVQIGRNGNGNINGRIQVPVVNVKEVCGTVRIEKDKIQNGLKAEEGHYPWQLAMIQRIGVSSQYVCSAGLISQRYALSAGHCVTSRDGQAKSKNEFLLYAGSVHLHSNSDNVQVYQLASIDVHPQYNSNTLENDIAILGLQYLAHITDYVRPICLPTEKMKLNDLYNKRGIVAGWGYTAEGLVNDLRFARMPIVSAESCIYSDRKFYSLFISPRVFCAGGKNGTSVCQGDSGAPLALENPETGEDRFYVRGIVSLSKVTFGLKCDPYDYAIFTDVASYMPFIKEIVDI